MVSNVGTRVDLLLAWVRTARQYPGVLSGGTPATYIPYYLSDSHSVCQDIFVIREEKDIESHNRLAEVALLRYLTHTSKTRGGNGLGLICSNGAGILVTTSSIRENAEKRSDLYVPI